MHLADRSTWVDSPLIPAHANHDRETAPAILFVGTWSSRIARDNVFDCSAVAETSPDRHEFVAACQLLHGPALLLAAESGAREGYPKRALELPILHRAMVHSRDVPALERPSCCW